MGQGFAAHQRHALAAELPELFEDSLPFLDAEFATARAPRFRPTRFASVGAPERQLEDGNARHRVPDHDASRWARRQYGFSATVPVLQYAMVVHPPRQSPPSLHLPQTPRSLLG